MKIGELCAGYGGLGMGVQAVLGGELAWVSEYEPPSKANPGPTQGAARILAHRFPGVPNLGDMTTVDWSTVEPVDVLTGGTPCQDLSHAGKRAGMTEGTRSNLWVAMRDAIDQLRPSLIVWENVRGAYSAPADSDLESREGRLGVRSDGPVLRALGRVLGDLSELGFDAEWIGLRAADVGAPHGRYRVFVVAWPAGDPHGPGLEGRLAGRRPNERAPRSASVGPASDSHSGPVRQQPVALPGSSGSPVAGLPGADAPAHPARHGRHEGWPEPARLVRGSDAAVGGGAADANPARYPRRLGDGDGVPAREWGPYAEAIDRWERCLGRTAPAPTELSAKGSPRLSPAFVEWMQGLPAGWVTDVPGLSRNEQLKALGNGVVPQQAAQALRLLLPDIGEVAA